MSSMTRRLVASVAGVLMTLGIASAARADVLFRNTTDQPIYFSISCSGDGQDNWQVAPHSTRSLYCTNGEQEALVKIATDRGGYDHVLQYWVWDGKSYRLDYDRNGDVNMWQL